MTLTRVKIPGKVMLSGEYAVLYGGMSVLMPVPRFIEFSEIDSGTIESYSPVVTEATKLEIPEIAPYEDEHGLPGIIIDNHEFYNQDAAGQRLKLGLGSSAAEAVGIIKLRFLRAGYDLSADFGPLLKYAYMAHDKAQGGVGSGADVAACALNCPLKFTSKFDIEQNQVDRYVAGLQLKYQYTLNLLWTGVSADTRAMVKQFGAWYHSRPEKARAMVGQLKKAADHLAEKWFMVPELDLYDALDEFNIMMSGCAHEAGITYHLPIHHQIEAWARSHGGRAKPTGAGGGDMILLIGDLPVDELDHPIINLKF
jgi:mevalonate kinase